MSSPVLKDIFLYPLKSGAAIPVQSSEVEHKGVIMDRRFVVVDDNGRFISARTDFALCLVHFRQTGEQWCFSAPEMPELQLHSRGLSAEFAAVSVWSDSINAQSCGAAADKWFSRYLNKSCRLFYFAEQSSRFAPDTTEPVAFADGYPLLLLSQPSVNYLNTRSPIYIDIIRFRPNLVVENCLPHAEDSWRELQIGDARFELISPCVRCIMTTVNPDNAAPHRTREPLTTLSKYRQTSEGEIEFAHNLIVKRAGSISRGDKIEIIRSRQPRIYVDNYATKEPATQVKAAPEKFTLRCISVKPETHDVNTFCFEPFFPREFDFIAGQHLRFDVQIQGVATRRCYTLSSSPNSKRHLAITVKRIPGGKVSNYLHDHFAPGNILCNCEIAGDFHLADKKLNKVLLLSAGSGVTPMLSMLHWMTEKRMDNDIVLFHSTRTKRDIIAESAITELAQQHGNCQVFYTFTGENSSAANAFQGRLTAQMLQAIPHIAQRQVFICGPDAFRAQAKEFLATLDVAKDRIHEESFGTAVSISEAIKDIPLKSFNMTIASYEAQLSVNNQQTLLEQCEQADISIPFSCRAGICGQCKVKLIDGKVSALGEFAGLDKASRDAGYVLSCSCVPDSDLVIEPGD